MVHQLAQFMQFVSIVVFALAFLWILVAFLQQTKTITTLFPFRFRWPHFQDKKTNTQKEVLRKRNCFKAYFEKLFIKTTTRQGRHLFFSIFTSVLLTRLSLLLLGYLGYILRNNESPGIIYSLRIIWEKWDSSHYLWIAQNWYTNVGEERLFIVFFPLYPLMIRVFSFLFQDYFVSGLLVSLVSLTVACFYLYKLVEIDYSAAVAKRCIRWVLIFPYTFFLSLVFTESLFLALGVLAFYAMRHKRWILAGFFGLLASLTRNFGFFLFIPLLIEYAISTDFFENLRNRHYREIAATFWKLTIRLGLIALGFFLYLLLNKWITGDWFRFLTYLREHWHQDFGFFAQNIQNQFTMALTWKPIDRLALWVPQLSLLLLSMVAILASLRTMRLSYLAYMFTLVFVSFSATWLLSGPRYTTTMFPIYIFLARISENEILDGILTFFSLTMLCVYALAYTWGAYVM